MTVGRETERRREEGEGKELELDSFSLPSFARHGHHPKPSSSAFQTKNFTSAPLLHTPLFTRTMSLQHNKTNKGKTPRSKGGGGGTALIEFRGQDHDGKDKCWQRVAESEYLYSFLFVHRVEGVDEREREGGRRRWSELELTFPSSSSFLF